MRPDEPLLPELPGDKQSRDSASPFGDDWLELAREAGRSAPLARMGAYDLLEEIGRGGQGVVYRATDTSNGETVAVKRLARGLFSSERARRRFEREAEILSGLRHPGIVSVYGLDDSDGLPSLVLEWIEGQPITLWAREQGDRTEIDAVVDRFILVCEAIQYAHQNGVLHRDLKPDNVLVDDEGNPRVLDFGIARPVGHDPRGLTETQEFVGTPAYSSPEQLPGSSRDIDTRTDIYSLGVLLFEMLTGQLPESAAKRVRDVGTSGMESVRRASGLRRDLGPELDAVCMRALELDPRDRYQSCASLAGDLQRYRKGEPVLARVPGRWSEISRFLRRNRLLAASLLGLFVAVTTIAVLSVLGRRELSEERDRVQQQAIRAQASLDLVTGALLVGTLQSSEHEMTVVDMLELACDRISLGEGVDEQTEADLRTQFALALELHGRPSEALEQAQRVMELIAETDRGLWARNAAIYAKLQAKVRKNEGLAELLDEVLPLVREEPNLLHRNTSLTLIASALQYMGRYADSESLLELVVQTSQQLGNQEGDSMRHRAVLLLAKSLESQSRLEEGIRLLRSELERAEMDSETPSASVWNALYSLTNQEQKAGQITQDQAIERKERLLEISLGLSPRMESLRIASYRMLCCDMAVKDPERAQALYEEGRQRALLIYGRESSSYASIVGAYAFRVSAYVDRAAGTELHRDAREVYLKLSQGESTNSINHQIWIGNNHAILGDYERARIELDSAVRAAAEIHPPDYEKAYLPVRPRAHCEFLSGDRDAGLQWTWHGVNGLMGCTRPSDAAILRELRSYAGMLELQGEPEEAERVRKRILEREWNAD